MAPGNSVNVVVVGAGSIGSRHQRILKQLGHQVSVVSANSPNGDFVSSITRAFEMPAEVSIDIDSIEDFERASKYFNEHTITTPMDQLR